MTLSLASFPWTVQLLLEDGELHKAGKKRLAEIVVGFNDGLDDEREPPAATTAPAANGKDAKDEKDKDAKNAKNGKDRKNAKADDDDSDADSDDDPRDDPEDNGQAPCRERVRQYV